MPIPMTPSTRARVVAIALAAAVLSVSAAPAALASQGSVPAEVAAFAADPEGLVASLDDLAGVGGSGKGIDFDETTAIGQLNRVWVFTSDFVAGVATDTPVERLNEWSAPVSIADKPVGLATIWINPATVKPELATFVQGVTIGAALVDVPADATLVRDEPGDVWFSLVGEDLTPLFAATPELDVPTTLSAYQDVLVDRAGSATTPPPSAATPLSVAVVVGVVLLIVAVLLVPIVRARRKGAAAPLVEPEPVVEPEPEPVVAPTPARKPAAARKPAVARKPAAAEPATAKPEVAKPATSKAAPAKKPSTGASATRKPRTPKPPTAE